MTDLMEYVETLLLLVILIGAVAFHILRSNRKKQAIQREIERLGGHISKISEIYGDRDKETFTYKVEFTDEFGRDFQTSCKIRARGFRNELYWTRSPTELMNSVSSSFDPHYSGAWGEDELIRRKVTGSTAEAAEERAVSELKQQVIDELYSENQQLKQELERLRKTANIDRK